MIGPQKDRVPEIRRAKLPRWMITGVVLFLLGVSARPTLAGIPPLDDLATKIQETMGGTIARVIAVIALMALGYACLDGRIRIRPAITVIAGIAVIFGAAQIISYLFG